MKNKNKTYWENGCDHPEDSYVGSFEYYTCSAECCRYDLYAYQSHSPAFSMGVCLRSGNDLKDYMSFPCLSYLPTTDLGRKIWQMLLENGKITWTKTKKEN